MSAALRHAIVFVSFVLCNIACVGPSLVGGGTHGGDGGASSSASSAGQSAGASVATTGGPACDWAPVSLAPGIDPAQGCEHLVSKGEASPVTIRIRNDREAVVWLTSGDCMEEYVFVEDAAGNFFRGNHCLHRCEASLLGECGCLGNCPRAETVAVSPGGTFATQWLGWVVDGAQQVASAECAANGCGGECSLIMPPADGQMRISISSASALDCGDECECTPNREGYCFPHGYPETDGGGVAIHEFQVDWPPPCPEITLVLD